MTTNETRILKVDAAGRVWTPKEDREAVLDAFECSGLPAARFAREHGIRHQTFYSWLRKRRLRRKMQGSPQTTLFAEAVVDRAPKRNPRKAEPSDGLRVELSGGIAMVVANSNQATLAAQIIRDLSNLNSQTSC